MKRTIWIMLVLVMGLLLGGCRIEDIGTSEPIEEEEEKVSENQLWHPIAQDKVECLLYDYYNQRIVAYSLKKKRFTAKIHWVTSFNIAFIRIAIYLLRGIPRRAFLRS